MAARQPPTSAYALANNTGQGMRARSRGSAKAATLIRVSCVARGNPRDRCDRSVSCGLSLRRWRAACTYDERGASCVLLTETAASSGEAAVSPLGGEVASARRDKRGGSGTLPGCSTHQHDLPHRTETDEDSAPPLRHNRHWSTAMMHCKAMQAPCAATTLGQPLGASEQGRRRAVKDPVRRRPAAGKKRAAKSGDRGGPSGCCPWHTGMRGNTEIA